MTDREKLLNLMKEVEISQIYFTSALEKIADYLISNGVDIREKGEWIDEGRDSYGEKSLRCPVCGGDDRAFVYTNFCRWCGSDMRKNDETML